MVYYNQTEGERKMNANITKIGVAVRTTLAALAVTACVGTAMADVSVGLSVGVGVGGGVAVGTGVGVGGGVAVGTGMELDFGTCHRELSPYGMWTTTAECGDVWVPAGMPAGWHPYSYGQWVYTDVGWYWQSNYTWGWLPFHYGRWYRHPDYGWCWVPGYVWAPAWVTWYYTDAYVGWAPIPACGAGVAFAVAPCDWFFVGCGSFMVGNLWACSVPGYCVGPTVCASYTVINNYYFIGDHYHCGTRRCGWYGPAPRVIEQHVHHKLEPFTIASTDIRTRNGKVGERRLEIYRPGATRQLVQREIPERILTKVERTATSEPGRSVGTPRIVASPTGQGKVELPKGGDSGRTVNDPKIGASGRVVHPQPTETEKEKHGTTATPRVFEPAKPIGETRPVGTQPVGTPRVIEPAKPIGGTRPVGTQPVGTPRVIEPAKPFNETRPVGTQPVVRPLFIEKPTEPHTANPTRTINDPRTATPVPAAPVRTIGQPAKVATPPPAAAQPVTPRANPSSSVARPTGPASPNGLAPVSDNGAGDGTVNDRRSR